MKWYETVTLLVSFSAVFSVFLLVLTKRVRRLEQEREGIAHHLRSELVHLSQELHHLSVSLLEHRMSPHHNHAPPPPPQDQPRMFIRRFPSLSRQMMVTVDRKGFQVRWASLPKIMEEAWKRVYGASS
jgi:hypothetical protein